MMRSLRSRVGTGLFAAGMIVAGAGVALSALNPGENLVDGSVPYSERSGSFVNLDSEMPDNFYPVNSYTLLIGGTLVASAYLLSKSRSRE
jgi:hypothetical protein